MKITQNDSESNRTRTSISCRRSDVAENDNNDASYDPTLLMSSTAAHGAGSQLQEALSECHDDIATNKKDMFGSDSKDSAGRSEETSLLTETLSPEPNVASAPLETAEQDEDEDEMKLPQSIPHFPLMMYEILSTDAYSNIICWLPHGRGFIIRDKKKFASEVLPRYFRQTKFTSWTRKMNRWQFTRVSRGAEAGAYYNPMFVRGNKSLAMKMQCANSNPSTPYNPMNPFPSGVDHINTIGNYKAAANILTQCDTSTAKIETVVPSLTGNNSSSLASVTNLQDQVNTQIIQQHIQQQLQQYMQQQQVNQNQLQEQLQGQSHQWLQQQLHQLQAPQPLQQQNQVQPFQLPWQQFLNQSFSIASTNNSSENSAVYNNEFVNYQQQQQVHDAVQQTMQKSQPQHLSQIQQLLQNQQQISAPAEGINASLMNAIGQQQAQDSIQQTMPNSQPQYLAQIQQLLQNQQQISSPTEGVNTSVMNTIGQQQVQNSIQQTMQNSQSQHLAQIQQLLLNQQQISAPTEGLNMPAMNAIGQQHSQFNAIYAAQQQQLALMSSMGRQLQQQIEAAEQQNQQLLQQQQPNEISQQPNEDLQNPYTLQQQLRTQHQHQNFGQH